MTGPEGVSKSQPNYSQSESTASKKTDADGQLGNIPVTFGKSEPILSPSITGKLVASKQKSELEGKKETFERYETEKIDPEYAALRVDFGELGTEEVIQRQSPRTSLTQLAPTRFRFEESLQKSVQSFEKFEKEAVNKEDPDNPSHLQIRTTEDPDRDLSLHFEDDDIEEKGKLSSLSLPPLPHSHSLTHSYIEHEHISFLTVGGDEDHKLPEPKEFKVSKYEPMKDQDHNLTSRRILSIKLPKEGSSEEKILKEMIAEKANAEGLQPNYSRTAQKKFLQNAKIRTVYESIIRTMNLPVQHLNMDDHIREHRRSASFEKDKQKDTPRHEINLASQHENLSARQILSIKLPKEGSPEETILKEMMAKKAEAEGRQPNYSNTAKKKFLQNGKNRREFESKAGLQPEMASKNIQLPKEGSFENIILEKMIRDKATKNGLKPDLSDEGKRKFLQDPTQQKLYESVITNLNAGKKEKEERTFILPRDLKDDSQKEFKLTKLEPVPENLAEGIQVIEGGEEADKKGGERPVSPQAQAPKNPLSRFTWTVENPP